jgi:hypothetical protein
MDTGGIFDNSYFDNSKSDKTDYIRLLEGLVFEKKNLWQINWKSQICSLYNYQYFKPNLNQPNLTCPALT